MRKRLLRLSCAALLLFICSGCVDFYVGKRPDDQNNTRWVCDTLDIFFEVREPGVKLYGQINMNGAVTDIFVSFAQGTGVDFMPVSAIRESGIAGDAWLFSGRCKFSEDMLVVTVFNNSKGFLDDSVRELVFVREDIAP